MPPLSFLLTVYGIPSRGFNNGGREGEDTFSYTYTAYLLLLNKQTVDYSTEKKEGKYAQRKQTAKLCCSYYVANLACAVQQGSTYFPNLQ